MQICALVAQLDRALDYESRGQEFDGKNVMFVHAVPSIGSASMMVTDTEVDQIVTQAKYMKPRAFNEKFFGGKTAPDKLKYITGSLNRAIAKRETEPRRRVLKTRREFLEFYQNQFNFFNPSKTGKMGAFLNRSMTRDLTRKR